MHPDPQWQQGDLSDALKRLRTAGDYYARRQVLDDLREERGHAFAQMVERLFTARSRA